MDEEGYCFIVDRKKDMIITGGFDVYPTEGGEAAKTVLVLKRGAAATQARRAVHCRKLLFDFKTSRSVGIVNELPKKGNGKIARRQLRDIYWAGRDRQVW